MQGIMHKNIQLRMGIIVATIFGSVLIIGYTILPGQFETQGIKTTYQNSRPHIHGADWPGYLYDAQNTNYNPQETTLTPDTIKHLDLVSTVTAGNGTPFKDTISSSVVNVGDTIYFGSWNGNEYAVDAYTHVIRWQRFLGINHPPDSQQCTPTSAGVSSNSLWDNNIIYVGGGDGNMYALNAITGAIVWKTAIATPPDEYLWGSPVLGNGHIYIGVASFGDCPLIRGHMDMLDSLTGTILLVHYTVKPGSLGNTFWNKAALIPTLNEVLYGTGNGPDGEIESQSIVALDWNSLNLDPKNVYPPPVKDFDADPDFGASCMVIPDIGDNQPGALCHNKNTIVYAVALTPGGLKLKWSSRLGIGGDSPNEGLGDITSGSYDGKYVYFSTTNVVINGTTYLSAVYALDPKTGTIIWRTPLTMGFPLSALAGANGFLVIGLVNSSNRGSMAVLSAKTGQILYSHPLSSSVYGSPSIANGQIFVPTADGHVYIFGLAQPLQATDTFSGTKLDNEWIWVNTNLKHERLTGTALALDAAGKYEVDNMNLLTKSAPTSDFALTARVNFTPLLLNEQAVITAYQGPGNYVKVGIINKGTKYPHFELTGYVQGKAVITYQADDTAPPNSYIFLQIVKLGSTVYGYASIDGINWIDLGSMKPPFTMTLVGLDAFYTDNGTFDTANFSSCTLIVL